MGFRWMSFETELARAALSSFVKYMDFEKGGTFSNLWISPLTLYEWVKDVLLGMD